MYRFPYISNAITGKHLKKNSETTLYYGNIRNSSFEKNMQITIEYAYLFTIDCLWTVKMRL